MLAKLLFEVKMKFHEAAFPLTLYLNILTLFQKSHRNSGEKSSRHLPGYRDGAIHIYTCTYMCVPMYVDMQCRYIQYRYILCSCII